MAGVIVQILAFICVCTPALITAQSNDAYSNLLEVEAPAVLSYNSPLRQPDSLRSRPYFDFLSTLYRRDSDKNELFRPYVRSSRAVGTPTVDSTNRLEGDLRQKRAIVFRPLFVYKQQEIKKQQIAAKRKRV